ncbi:MAG: glycosyltransferase family 4 protein [bacterium]
MKTVFFCNLIPLKKGAFEALLVAIGAEFKKAGDEFVVVFSGAPIPSVAEALRATGVRWHILKEWVGGEDRLLSKGLKGASSCPSATKQPNNPTTAAGERVRPWGFVLPALRLLRQERPDVVAVHFGNELPALVTILIARLVLRKRLRWIWHQHQQIAAPATFWQRHVSRIRLLSFLVDGIVALYEGGRQVLKARGVPDGKIVVVPNGTQEPTRTRPPEWLRASCGLPSKSKLVANISSLITRKRVDITIEAFAKVSPLSGHLPYLLLVGTGPEEDRLRALIAERGIANQVIFMGQRDDVGDIIAESDVVCLSSSAEACPYVLLEAMSLGRPCIATNAGAVTEIVEDTVTGYIVPRASVGALADRVTALLDNPELAEQCGRMGRKKWESCFTLDGQVSVLLALYSSNYFGHDNLRG